MSRNERFRNKMQDAGCKIQDAGSRIQDPGFRTQDSERKSKVRFYLAAVFFSAIIANFAFAAAVPSSKNNSEAKITDASQKKVAPDSKATPVPVDAVTVIGSRLPSYRKKLLEIPSNVTYVSQNVTHKNEEALELVQPLTYQQAVSDAEGLIFFDSTGNGLDTSVGIRGFADSSSTVVLVDGVRVNELDGDAVNYPLLSMNDTESIQIERGSASPVYGSNAFGGVVNLTTGQPSSKPLKIFGSLERGSFRALNFNQGFSGTLQDKLTPVGGKWTYYFNGGRDVGDGFRDNGEWRITSLNAKTSYELPDQDGRVYFGVKHIRNAVGNPGELTAQEFQDDVDGSNKPLDGRDFKNTILHGGIDKKFLDDKLLASVFASHRRNLNHLLTTFGTFTDFPDGFDPDTNRITVNSRETDLVWQLTYADTWGDIGYEGILGMEFRNGQQYALQQDAFQGVVVERTQRETERSADPDNVGLFWRDTLKFFDKVIPYFGMRHDFNSLRTRDHLNQSNNISERWNNSTFSTGVTVKPVDWADLFANYSQGFRVPTVSEIAPFSGAIATGLNPEQSDSYELGTRLRYQDTAQFKTSWFLIDVEDEITFDSTTRTAIAPFGQNINVGKTRRYGVETRLDLNPIEEIDLYGSYTWTRAYVAETNPSGTLADGRELGQVPENRFTYGTYVRPLARFGELYEDFKIGLNGVFTSRQHPSGYESNSQALLNATGGAGHVIKSFTVWNFITSYAWREKEIYFKINNLFNEKYYSRAVNATSFGTSIYPSGNYTFVNPGAPREFVLGSKWEF